jgi:hypothetical protein
MHGNVACRKRQEGSKICQEKGKYILFLAQENIEME